MNFDHCPKVPRDDAAGNVEYAIRAEVRRELEIARAKYGEHFELLCIEGSYGDTIDDGKALELLRTLNRTSSMYSEVICQV
ncbi:hypothetical protein [Allomesorhizobium alhagi]|uniref:Uncharacterized protein n=1 Tax=Mesorhizobium alhagi CCNWXJ12-2 TaxID=1107882 RepID=H0I0P1_9HYPH|nr:hypothetical protein [Mesorhizobium alhagi]EHK53466.1 hypothetical protein MAXJ12_30142 [Mesorhizobium alhagi CCNWXJ12-2]